MVMSSSTAAEFSSEKCILRIGRPLNSTFLSGIVTRWGCQDLANFPPLIARLEKLLTWLKMIPCPSFVDGVMLPKSIGAMLGLCGSSRLRIKYMSKGGSFSWKGDIVKFHMLTPEVSVIRLGVPDAHSTSNAGPCLIHVLSRTCIFSVYSSMNFCLSFGLSIFHKSDGIDPGRLDPLYVLTRRVPSQ